MIKIYEQNFIPASKGLIKSAPSSLIPDGSFQEVLNVRFGDGYVEKVRGFVDFKTLPQINGQDQKVIKIDLYKKSNGDTYNIVHTRHGVYTIDDNSVSNNLVSHTPYEVPEIGGSISSVNAFDEYIYTSYGTDICYLHTGVRQNGQQMESDKVRKLEGTYVPNNWQSSHAYTVGDVVKPTSYNGYVYQCTQSGTSGSSQPTWATNLSSPITDNTAKWIGIGSLDLEGQTSVNNTLQARCVALYKGFLFVANTMEGEQECSCRLRWSQQQNPRMWHNNEDGSGLAGYVDVYDTDGQIIALKTMNDVLYVYKERSIIAVTYTGGEDYPFTKEVITTRAGLISPEAIVELPHMHIFIGQDDIYAFDGNTCTPIGDSVSDWLFNNIRPDGIYKIRGYYNEESQDVTFSFPSTNNYKIEQQEREGQEVDVFVDNVNCDIALTYNTKQRTWSMREMYLTAIGQYNQTSDRIIDEVGVTMDADNSMIDSALFSKDKVLTLIGDEKGKLYLLKEDTDSRLDEQDGFKGYVITKTHHMDAPDRIKRLMRIQFHIETSTKDYDLYCRVGSSWNAEERNDQIDWTPKLYMNLRKPNPWYNHHIAPFVDVDLSARYFQIEFGTEHSKEPFKILGYTLFYQLRSDE